MCYTLFLSFPKKVYAAGMKKAAMGARPSSSCTVSGRNIMIYSDPESGSGRDRMDLGLGREFDSAAIRGPLLPGGDCRLSLLPAGVGVAAEIPPCEEPHRGVNRWLL